MEESKQIVEVFGLIFGSIIFLSLFISPRFKIHYFVILFMLTFPALGVTYVYPAYEIGGVKNFLNVKTDGTIAKTKSKTGGLDIKSKDGGLLF